MRKALILGGLVLTFAFCLAGGVSTQTTDTATQPDAAAAAGTNIAETAKDLIDLELKDVNLEEITKLPSGWGLFWQGVKERAALALITDPVKKAERYLQYAEQRMKLAEYIADNSTDPKMQKWAEKMIEKSNQFVGKIEGRKDKWLAKPESERVQTLARNIATHQLRRERVVDKLEAKFSEENRERVRAMREKALESSGRLIKAITNERLPEEVKAHLERVKERLEVHLEAVRQYQEKKIELLKEAAAGDEDAREELKQLWGERKTELESVRKDFKAWVE